MAPYVACALAGGLLAWFVITPERFARRPYGARVPDALRTAPGQYKWTDLPEAAFPLPPYARFLARTTIVLDPGHGGRADRANWKRGPTGLREAVVNLRVAQFLREFLVEVGADVVLTRDTDGYLDADDSEDLRLRAELANRLRADLLLSIHHNASDREETNHTVLFYHQSPDHSPASLCAARYLLTGLNDALRLESHLECALLSDALLYESGLAILRHAGVPAVLSEASFHSNPAEERRLRDPAYNRREAYGLFLGLARWAQAGLPRVGLQGPANEGSRGGQVLLVKLDDGLSSRGGWGKSMVKILADSLVVELDGQPLPVEVDLERGQLRAVLPSSAWHAGGRLYVDFENIFGQHVLHPWIELDAVR